MDSSNEDLFSEACSGSPVKRESIRFSTYTIYQSANDLQMNQIDGVDSSEDHTLVGEKVVNSQKSKRNPNNPVGPTCCKKMFEDGLRSVDFVVAWEEGKGPMTAELKRKVFMEKLISEGLELEMDSLDKLRFLKIHTPVPVLQRFAEVLRLRMPMKEIPGQEDMLASELNLMSELKSWVSRLCSCVKLDPHIFPPEKFKLSAEYSPHKSYLFDDNCEELFSGQNRTVITNYILERTRFNDDPSATMALGVERLLEEGVFKAAFPLHDGECGDVGSLRCLLLREWANVSKWAMYQPIDQVREYFGVKFALYFAWLGFYTHMLVPASIAGLLVCLYGLFTLPYDTLSRDICDSKLNITMCPLCDLTCDYWNLSDTCTYSKLTYLFDNPATVVFAILMSFWAALFLELWKRYSASIAHRWGLTDFTPESEPPRPQYLAKLQSSDMLSKKAKYKVNSVTGFTEPVLPFWSIRLPAFLISFSVVFLLAIVAVMTVLGVVLYRMSVLASVSLTQDKEWISTYSLIIVPSTSAAINLIFITILNWIYDRIALWLTELELHRTQTEFDESLTLKIYLFQFVNYYTSIMYIAFIKGKFVGTPAKYNKIFGFRQEECNPGGCLMELCIQLAIIMVGQQALNAITENLLPYFWTWLNSLSIKAGLSEAEQSGLSSSAAKRQWTHDYKLLPWGPRGLFYEYLEIVMQYGFVTLFVPAFPLAPLFALVNNIFEMRLDAAKFLKNYRRPVPTRAPNIGVWFKILDILGRLAVISNAFIIAFSSNFIPRLVYMLTVSENRSDEGFLQHSLALFSTVDFANGTAPRFPSVNVSVCRYPEYRESYLAVNKYKRPAIYWHVLAARLAFIVIFQNLVSMVVMLVRWAIPDVPQKLKDQIRREAYLTNELIIEHERRRALYHRLVTDGEDGKDINHVNEKRASVTS